MSGNHSGACLCGEVRFEVEGDFARFYLCHCEYCRKDTGSAHAANLFSPTAKLKWISGADKAKVFTLPSTRHTKSFCTNCGSALPLVEADGGWLMVPAGSLNTEVPIRPDAHIFVASKAGWDEELEKIPKLDRFPD